MHSITQLEPIDYLVIGHITRDLTPQGARMGGTASYSARTAQALGLNVGVVTSWGEEFSDGFFDKITVVNKPAPHSTTFENIYTPEGRVQIIHQQALPLGADTIPEQWKSTPIVHLGPIAQEVMPGLVDVFPHSMVCVTPQGWLRSWDSEGRIHPIQWNDEHRLLEKAHAVVISVEDVGGDEDEIANMASACSVLVVTEEHLGARVYWNQDVRRIAAPNVEEIDPTGAGDIFATAFFTHYHKTKNPWEAARFANIIAACSVSRIGLESIPQPEEIKKASIEVF